MKHLVPAFALGLLASSTALADPPDMPPSPTPTTPDPTVPVPNTVPNPGPDASQPPSSDNPDARENNDVGVPANPPTTNDTTTNPATDTSSSSYPAHAYGAVTVGDDTSPGIYSWGDPRFSSGIGVDLTVGGGITGFTDKSMRNTVSDDVGGLWDFHASFGTRTPIGIEVSYLGSEANVQSFTNQNNGTLIGTTAEADLRWNILPHEGIDPYIFAGMGWTRYDLTSARLSQADSGIADEDDVAEFPMGVGMSFRSMRGAGFTADLRGTFRATTGSTLVASPDGSHPDLHSWEASAAVGYEF